MRPFLQIINGKGSEAKLVFGPFACNCKHVVFSVNSVACSVL